MNNVVLMGRLTKDPDVRYTQAQEPMAIARYTLAVDRNRAKKDGEQNADFISCVAFGKAGEFAEKYLKKGTKICIRGHIQTGSYDHKDGYKVYTTEVVVDQQEFCEGAKQDTAARPQAPAAGQMGIDGFMQIPDVLDEELPFH